MEKEKYIKKWIEGTLSADEKETFEQSETFKDYQKIFESLRAFKAEEYPIEEEWEKINTRISGQGADISKIWYLPIFRVAAIFVVLIGIYFIFLHQNARTIRTGTAENREFLLPDSSSVALNAESQLTYSEKNWNDSRSVRLEGEAFFEVAHGSRFDVVTSSGIVSVLGTRFNVKNRPGFFEVACYDGLVQVENSGELTRLPPHHKYLLLNGNISVIESHLGNSPSWILDESSFQSIPFYFVIREFERQYDVEIIVENVDINKLFTGRFVNSDMELAIQSVANPLNLQYQILEDRKIVLTGNPG